MLDIDLQTIIYNADSILKTFALKSAAGICKKCYRKK